MKISIDTSQETHYFSATEPNQLMLFGETVAVYCENHKKQINTLCGQDVQFCNVMPGGK
jgi:thioredoxin-related protein